jgi:ATP-binding cassette subfamily C protein CydCD
VSRPIDPRLVRAAPSLRPLLLAYALVQFTGAALVLVQAVVLGRIVAGLVTDLGHIAGLAHLLLVLVAAGLGRAVLSGAQEWLAARGSVRVRAELRGRVVGAVRRLGPVWVAGQPAGRLVTAAGPGLETADGYLSRALPALIGACVVPPVVLVAIAVADLRAGIVLLVLLPLVPLFLAVVGIATGRRMQRQYDLLARLAGHFLDLVAGLTSLRVYGRATHQVETVRRASESYRSHTMATLRSAFVSGLVLDLVATLSVAIVAVDIGLRLDHGGVSLAPALTVLLLTPELFAPLRALGAVHHATVEGRTATGAALDVLDEVPATAQRARSTAVPGAGHVRLENVTVRHPGRVEPALAGVDLTFLPGEIVVVSGPSGAGKTTLLATVLGFTEPDGGQVCAGDAPLNELDPDAWRAGTAWVPQRPRPTRPTAGAEAALGHPGAAPAEVDAALLACAAPPAETALGEGGTALSAGQRRRLALARALLRARHLRSCGRVPVVLLDEPSEDLDADTETVVAGVLDELRVHAIVLVATHSARLRAAADRVVDLDAGRVVADRRQLPVRIGRRSLAPHRRTREPVSVARRAVDPVVSPRRAAAAIWHAGLLSGAAGLAGLALTATSLWLICRAAQHPNLQALAVAVVGVRTFALGRALLRYLERLSAHDGALRVLADVRTRIFAALVPLVPAGLDVRRGDLLRRFVTDVDGVQEGLVRTVVPTTGAAVTAVGAIGLATALVPPAGTVLAAALLVGALAAPALARAVSGRARRAAQLAAERDNRVTALLDGLPELAAYGADATAAAAAAECDAEVVAAGRRPALAAAAGAALCAGASAVALAGVLALAAPAVRSGTIGGPAAAVLVACVFGAFEAASGLPAAFAAWSRHREGLARVREVLATPEPVPAPAVPVHLDGSAVSLRARGLAVAPAPGVADAVSGVDLDVTAGRRIAITGPSGCGKSTLLAGLLRLLPATAGRLDVVQHGQAMPLADVAPADLPAHVAGSLNGDHVFDTTLRDNLRVVRPEASDAELDAVAARAGLEQFLAALPAGWSTPAGSDGAYLSGGQRQRLLLARALLADPDVLVLDEPTAHLDAGTERAVLADLLDATRDRTVVLTAHHRLPQGSLDTVLALDGTVGRHRVRGLSAVPGGSADHEDSISDEHEVVTTEVPA